MNSGRESTGPKGPLGSGARLGGKYVLGAELGRGGMGVVYAGEHRLLGRPVAIKVLRPELAANPGAIARFLREARAAASLRGAHAVRIFDVDRPEGGAPYMVMERLEGESLDALLDRRKRLPVDEAVGYVLEACEAVAEAHALGIVHRDLKPQNLFLTASPDGAPRVKVLDFGISKSIAEADAAGSGSLTGPNATLGSPDYMSPEQVRNAGSVDARTDLWSLGVILYELLTGRVPFEGDSVPHVLALVLSSAPPPLRAARADVPEVLEAVVARCLERDPDRRPADVAELAAALAPFGGPAAAALAARVRHALAAGPGSAPARLPHDLEPPPGDESAAPAVRAELETLSTPLPVATRRGPRRTWLVAAIALVAGVAWAGRHVGRPADAAPPAKVASPSDPPPPPPGQVAGPPDGPQGRLAGATASEALPGVGVVRAGALPSAGVARAGALPSAGVASAVRTRPVPPRASGRVTSPREDTRPAAAKPRRLDDLGLLP